MTELLSFPGLGLNFELNRIAFEFFGRPIYWYGIIIALGFLVGVILCSRWAPRFGVNPDHIYDYLLFAVPIGLVGARTYYVLFYLDLYRRVDGSFDWAAMFRISDGGIAIYGGIIAAAITLVVFCKVKKISFLAMADLGVHSLFIGQMIGRWGNFVNVEAYGALTTAPWRMSSQSIATRMFHQGYATEEQYNAILDGVLGVHPTFFYESMWNLVGIFIVYFIGRNWRKFDGQVFLTYLGWYGIGRFWIEGMRTDSLYFFGLEVMGYPLRTSQVLAFSSAAIAIGILLWQLRKPHSSDDLYVNRLSGRAGEE